ncbi:MAG: hypothetical protein ACXAAI_07140 [Promethearchaeota archaeon]|jgi:hypothetical protein
MNNSIVDQSAHFRFLINTISRLIEVPEGVLKPVILKALKVWLLKNNKPAEIIHSLPLHLKLNMIKQIFNIGKTILKQMLKAPKEKQGVIMDFAFERAFKFYMNFIITNQV